MGDMNKESPCVIQMIKDVHAVYEAMDDGAGQSEGIDIYFLDNDEKFVVSQGSSWPVDMGDGTIKYDGEVMWEESYTWNEMTMWMFSNRPLTLQEFKLYNEDEIKRVFTITDDEIDIEDFVRFAYNNPQYVPSLGHTHGQLKHKLFGGSDV